MRNFKFIFLLAFILGIGSSSWANVNPDTHGKNATASTTTTVNLRMDCAQGTSKVIQGINNVRAMLLNGGDVWWDLDDGQYVVPKVEPGIDPVSSIFAGAVWIGGFTGLNSTDPAITPNLKMAAQTYRNGTRNDFWPGPLTDQGTIEFDTCANWNKHFRVLGENIALHIKNWEIAKAEGRTELDPNEIPADVLGWPAVGNRWFEDIHGFDLPDASTSSQGLAFFFDNDDPNDPIPNEIDVYEPHLGDFPRIDISGCEVTSIKDAQYADEMYFWVYNDAAGNHTQSGGDAIRMEVQVQSFAWKSNDEINDMTFQRYKLINRATERIDSTFFAMWVDPDLGCYTDDYIGCDTSRSLAYVYNEDGLDGTTGCTCEGSVPTYCDKIPLLGVDYFRGPKAPKVLNSFGELVNPTNDQQVIAALIPLGMSSFTYANNCGIGAPDVGTCDPTQPAEFYNFISGSWRDGTPLTTGGSGYNSGGEQTPFAFPDTPDDPAGWTMCTSNLPFGDRRTLQASGPFTLVSQAVNELIVGVVWVPDVAHPCPNLAPLLSADDIAQALFDNCFDITDGPDAPDVDVVELDKEIVIILTNGDSLTTNNAKEAYSEIDLQAPPDLPEVEKSYVFEGYRIYQLIEPNVSPADFDDPDKSRLVTSVDIKNGISKLYNWKSEFNPSDPTQPLWIPELKNEGVLENGIRHTFSIKTDAFSDVNELVNHRKYYFTVIAYAYNNYEQFDPSTVVGQKRPYLEGRRNIGDGTTSSYTVIPRPIVYQNLNADYGDGPIITRIDGIGVGEQNVSMSQETEDAIFNGSFNGEITYKPGRGPIDVKIYNPLEVVDGEFELTFTDAAGQNDGNKDLDSEIHWQLTDLSNPSAPIYSEQTIERLNEQILNDYGFSINVGQTDDAGDKLDDTNGAIGYNEIYADNNEWFAGIPDGGGIFDYIKSDDATHPDSDLDPTSAFSRIGEFAPFMLCDYSAPTDLNTNWYTPTLRSNLSQVARNKNQLADLNNVDIVFTSDKSKWSRCVVIETAISQYYGPSPTDGIGLSTENGTTQFQLRRAESVDQNGVPDGDGNSMGWFPGYAIDQETGERLNIFFGENTVYQPENDELGVEYRANGRDMIWNPTDELEIPSGTPIHNVALGGQHYIYVTRTEYDECLDIRSKLQTASAPSIIKVLEAISWTSMAMLTEGASLLPIEDGLIPSDLRIELRVDNPFQTVKEGNIYNYPKYLFKLEGKAAEQVVAETDVETALDNINVVPNPYYGYSAYEINQFSNIVKITNLPPKCTITIYSLDGKFIRQYNRDEAGENLSLTRPSAAVNTSQVSPALEWDLKNSKSIPVASGVYLIHVDAPGLGERVIKWFGVARKFDPSGL